MQKTWVMEEQVMMHEWRSEAWVEWIVKSLVWVIKWGLSDEVEFEWFK